MGPGLFRHALPQALHQHVVELLVGEAQLAIGDALAVHLGVPLRVLVEVLLGGHQRRKGVDPHAPVVAVVVHLVPGSPLGVVRVGVVGLAEGDGRHVRSVDGGQRDRLATGYCADAGHVHATAQVVLQEGVHAVQGAQLAAAGDDQPLVLGADGEAVFLQRRPIRVQAQVAQPGDVPQDDLPIPRRCRVGYHGHPDPGDLLQVALHLVAGPLLALGGLGGHDDLVLAQGAGVEGEHILLLAGLEDAGTADGGQGQQQPQGGSREGPGRASGQAVCGHGSGLSLGVGWGS